MDEIQLLNSKMDAIVLQLQRQESQAKIYESAGNINEEASTGSEPEDESLVHNYLPLPGSRPTDLPPIPPKNSPRASMPNLQQPFLSPISDERLGRSLSSSYLDQSPRELQVDPCTVRISTGKTVSNSFQKLSADDNVKIEMDSAGRIFVFQSFWKNSALCECKLKVFQVEKEKFKLLRKFKWRCRKPSLFGVSRTSRTVEKIPADIAICDDELHVLLKSDTDLWSVEKWEKSNCDKSQDVTLFGSQIHLDCQNPFSISGSGKSLIILQRKSDSSTLLVVLEENEVRTHALVNVSVNKFPKAITHGDFILVTNSTLRICHVLKWNKNDSSYYENKFNHGFFNYRGNLSAIGVFSIGNCSPCAIGIPKDTENDIFVHSISLCRDNYRPRNLTGVQCTELRRDILGLFSTPRDGTMLFYTERMLGLLHVTTSN